MEKLKLKNNDGSINYELFSREADKWAREVNKEGSNSSNKSSQIRKFYDEMFKLNSRSVNYEQKKWENVILPQLHMLIPKVVYAKGRKLVTDKFVNMIKWLVESIKTKEDLKLATDFFEAFVGFYKFYEESNKRNN